MKYALVNEERQEAQPGLQGICPGCGNRMVAKCSEKKIRIWHWAHRGKRNCDYEWENETDWHRSWKNQFPESWQEIRIVENGVIHKADVKTDKGWVIEFQHSYLNPKERRARNAFYKKLVWVVNGTRRKRDIQNFNKTLSIGVRVDPNIPLYDISSDKNSLLKEWGDCDTPIFFDFGPGPFIWWFLPKWHDGNEQFVATFARSDFIGLFAGEKAQINLYFDKYFLELGELIKNYVKRKRRLTVPSTFYQTKDFVYWRNKIMKAPNKEKLRSVGEALPKFLDHPELNNGENRVTDEQVTRLRKIYSNKQIFFKDEKRSSR